MVKRGAVDWLVQRLSAMILGVYFIFLLAFCLMQSGVDYTVWHKLFANWGMRLFTLLALISLVAHTWIGMWTIGTDYVKHASARWIFQGIVVAVLAACFMWGLSIIWGV